MFLFFRFFAIRELGILGELLINFMNNFCANGNLATKKLG